MKQSWQQDLHSELIREPHRWFTIGELYERYRLRIPDYVAMRDAKRKYKEEFMPKDEKARWIYFLSMLRQTGIERRETSRWLEYSDRVRIRRVPGHCCKECGGTLVKASWGTANKFKCLECGDTRLFREASPPRRRQPPKKTNTINRIERLAPLEPVLDEIDEIDEVSTPTPPLKPDWDPYDIPSVPPPAPSLPPTVSNGEHHAIRDLVPMSALPAVPLSGPRLIAVRTMGEPMLWVDRSIQDAHGKPAFRINYVKREYVATFQKMGWLLLKRLDMHTMIGKLRDLIILVYRNHIMSPRGVAHYLKDLLPNFSLNRLEKELRECGYRPVALLEKYRISDDLHLIKTIHDEPVATFAQYVRMLQGKSDGARSQSR